MVGVLSPGRLIGGRVRLNTPAALFAAGEVGAWYDPSDLSTLYQDSVGTTPATAVDHPVGLMLDKSQGLALGAELISNGTFDTSTTGWTATGSSISIDAGRLRISTNSTFGRASQAITTVVGRSYRLTFTVTNGDATGCFLFVGTSDDLAAQNYDSGAKANGTHYAVFVATATTTYIKPVVGTGSSLFAFFDNISVRELAGNHAKQSTPTARPLLKQDANGRYYLQFDGTDDFLFTENIAWPGQYSAWAGVNVTTNASLQCIIDADPGAGTRTPQYLRVSSTTPQSIAFASGDFTDSGSAITSGTNVMLSAFATTTALDVRNNGASNGTTGISGTLASASTPLYLGRYAGSATAFMNARLYAAVVRGAASTAAEISSTDGWVNSKTGAY